MGMMYNMPIKNLALRLNGSNIPTIVKNVDGGSVLCVHLKNGEKVVASCSPSSWGGNKGLLEIFGGVTKVEARISEAFGGLTEDAVYERFKYCYENNTRYFKQQ